MDSSCTFLIIMCNWSPFVATIFWLFSYISNKNQDIFLKFSAFVYHVSGHNSISLPSTAHFFHNFERLKQLYLLKYLKLKKMVRLQTHMSILMRCPCTGLVEQGGLPGLVPIVFEILLMKISGFTRNCRQQVPRLQLIQHRVPVDLKTQAQSRTPTLAYILERKNVPGK